MRLNKTNVRMMLRDVLATAKRQRLFNEEGLLDVRLWADSRETWGINTGDVQYDAYHARFCSSGAIWPTMTRAELHNAADDLLSEISDEMSLLAEALTGGE